MEFYEALMNILFIINEHDNVSIDVHALTLVEAAKESHEVFVYSLKQNGALAARFKSVVGNRFYTSTGNFLGDIYKIKNLVNTNHICLIQTNGLRSDVVGIMAQRFCARPSPCLVSVRHNARFLEHDLYHVTKNVMYAVSCRLVTFNVAVALHIQKYITKSLHMPTSRVLCISNGVNVRQDARAAVAIKKKLGLRTSIPIVLYSGAFIERKNIYTLLEALRSLRVRFYCVLLGQGPLLPKIRDRIKKYNMTDKIFIEGQQSIGGYLSLANIFVLPSFSEGMSLALLEAMQMGVVQIVSDIAANTEVVTDHKDGLVFDAHSSQELQNRLNELVGSKQLHQALKTSAIKKIATQYTQKRMIAGYTKLYSQIEKKYV